MSLLKRIDWCETPLVSPAQNSETTKAIKKHLGSSMTSIPYLASVPWVAWSFTTKVQPVSHISTRLADLITLVVSMENACRHCYGATRSVLRLTGFSEKQISQLEEDLYNSELSEKEQLILSFARKCARSDPRPQQEDLEKLAAKGISRLEITEAAYVATNTCYSNRVATIIAIPPDSVETLEQHPVSRFVRPLGKLIFQNLFNRTKLNNIKLYESPGNVTEYQGIGAELVKALEGSPTAHVLRRTIDECWHSTVTSKRTKALAFAIIAQALDCTVCTKEACQQLAEQGLLQQDIDQLLRFLNSDKLSDFESRLVHFARDTVSYQVPEIQFIAREFLEGIDDETVIEIIGLVALANWMARLSIILYQTE